MMYFSQDTHRSISERDTFTTIRTFSPSSSFFLPRISMAQIFFNYNIDIVHPTEFQLSPTGSLYSKKGAKLVITIHDLIHERFGAPGNLYSKASRTNFYNRADGYIFVSKSTRDDFAEFYPELYGSRSSKVIWHGCNFPIKEMKTRKRNSFYL